MIPITVFSHLAHDNLEILAGTISVNRKSEEIAIMSFLEVNKNSITKRDIVFCFFSRNQPAHKLTGIKNVETSVDLKFLAGINDLIMR